MEPRIDYVDGERSQAVPGDRVARLKGKDQARRQHRLVFQHLHDFRSRFPDGLSPSGLPRRAFVG